MLIIKFVFLILSNFYLSEKSRQLAAIMFTDIAGYTAMMQENEEYALQLRNRQRAILEKLIPLHNGKILQVFGDGTLCMFNSAIEAVNCAVKIQCELQTEPAVPLRAGIHVGDIIYDDKDIFGDGVNVASRIESVSIAGGVFISEKVYDDIKNQPSLPAVSVGHFEFKNVNRPIEVFAVSAEGLKIPDGMALTGKLKNKAEIIAVLPFANMSADPENEYFSDGISEEILNALTKVKGLQVVSRTSSFSFKGKNEDMREIGKKLNASALIEGSVRKAGNRVRITAQLINTSDGMHYWSETFDRDLKDIFEIQDEISLHIAKRLEQQFGNLQTPVHLVKSSTTNLEAYDIYLKVIYKLNFAPTPELQLEVIEDLTKAVELDPNFAKAYAVLASTYITAGIWSLINSAEAFQKGKEYAQKALSIDDSLPEAYLALAEYKRCYEWDWDSVEENIKKALELSPDYAGAHVDYSNYLRSRGNFDEGLKCAEKACSLDPLSVNLLNNLANFYVCAGDYEKAEETYHKALRINPLSKPTLYEFAHMFCAKGEYERALDFVNDIIAKGGKWIEKNNLMALLYSKTGKPEAARKMLDDYLSQKKESGESLDFWYAAVLYTHNGEYENAVECLSKAADEKMGAVVLIKFSVSFFSLHNYEGFKKLCERIGLK